MVTTIIHYLDEFLVINHSESAEFMANVTLLLSVFEHLGIPVVVHKLQGHAPV